MSDIVIRVENLGKMYRIGTEEHRPANFWQATKQLAASPFDYLRRITRPPTEEETLWALKDVSFEVHRGEVVGVIGRNGAGKSTLLKILSRITEPTTGHAEIHGRVGSLLEVGTGFHPELTGRENIYLNGAILGMKRTEIDRKFDEIVAFSEIEKFLDTPVKRYSSGMYVRLAFAVAAHLDPEILLVDEVLAVGDAAFQKKALGKMGEVTQEGRTVLFVSHNMGAVSTLTDRSILLNRGELLHDDKTEDVVAKYLALAYARSSLWEAQAKTGHPIQIMRVRLLDSLGNERVEFDVRLGFEIEVQYEVRQTIRGAVVAVNVHAADGAHILSLEDTDSGQDLLRTRVPGVFVTRVCVPGYWLNSGTYLLRVGCGIPGVGSFENIEALTFILVETGDTTLRCHRKGYLLPMLQWETLGPEGGSVL